MRRGQASAISVVGVNHRTASVEQRERLAFSPSELPAALGRLRAELGGGVLLSTCNRSELYATTPDEAGQGEALVGLILSLKGLDESIAPGRFYVYRHTDAVRHLYRVAAGIDSMVVGEAQILGQVRQALAEADEAGSLNGILSRLFHSAIRVGKRARRETGIGRYALSVSAAAVDLARQTLGRLDPCTVLVISTGSTGKLAARSLAQSGATRILVTNRTYSRAKALAGQLGGRAIPFDGLVDALVQADVVISGTGAEGFVLGPAQVAAAMARRPDRALLLIDLAVPRDVDPAVRAVPGVRLFDIDGLQAVSQPRMDGLQGEVARVEAIIEEDLARLLQWWRSLDVVPVIAALRRRAEAIRRQELDKALRRMPDLAPADRQRLEAMSAAMVKKMLHDPITRLKSGEERRRTLEAVRELFGPLAEE